MADFYRQRITDSHGHTGILGVPIAPGTGTVALDTLRTAIAGVNLGTQGDSYVTSKADHTAGSDAKATDQAAIKFALWKVRVQESTHNKVVSFSIPCADNSLGAGDVDLDLLSAEGAALVSAVEAVFESEYGGTGTVLSITFENA